MTELERAYEVWKAVEEKIKQPVLEMAIRKDSGKIEIHFGSGDLKLANKLAML